MRAVFIPGQQPFDILIDLDIFDWSSSRSIHTLPDAVGLIDTSGEQREFAQHDSWSFGPNYSILVHDTDADVWFLVGGENGLIRWYQESGHAFPLEFERPGQLTLGVNPAVIDDDAYYVQCDHCDRRVRHDSPYIVTMCGNCGNCHDHCAHHEGCVR